MNIRLMKKEEQDTVIYLIQEAFQKGYEDYYGKCDDIIIPTCDILDSINRSGAKIHVVEENNEIIAGAVVNINENNHNSLEILFVKRGLSNKGVGFKLWSEIEKVYPDTILWHTCTPYFERRNIHFYVNKCKFVITEYLCEYHNPINDPSFIGDNGMGMLEFEKKMK